MAIRSAVYYPHTSVRDRGLVMTGLLLWDEVHYIVPTEQWNRSGSNDPDVDIALEVIGRKLVPSGEQKEIAHKQIMELVTSPELPPDFFVAPPDEDRYLVYPEKFLDETWDELSHAHLAFVPQNEGFHSYTMSSSLGLTMMSILADACAGSQKTTVTDRGSAYAALNKVLRQKSAGALHATLADAWLAALDTSGITLNGLVRLRQKESSPGGYVLRKHRHRLLAAIAEHVKEVIEQSRHEGDIEELDRKFRATIHDDWQALSGELTLGSDRLIFSSDLLVPILIITGLMPDPFTKMLTALMGAGKVFLDYRLGRDKNLEDHVTAYLNLARKESAKKK
jgi:hypothetical protein